MLAIEPLMFDDTKLRSHTPNELIPYYNYWLSDTAIMMSSDFMIFLALNSILYFILKTFKNLSQLVRGNVTKQNGLFNTYTKSY